MVSTNIPIILVINDMDRLESYFNNLTNKLLHPKSGSSASIVRFRGHAYIKWDPHLQTHFTTAEFNRLHRRFRHRSTEKLANFLNRSGLDYSPRHTRTTLEAITRNCDTCQIYSQAPRRFKFKIKENFQFNHTIYAYVLHINRRTILHVVEEATYYQAATWLKSMTANDLWLALRRCWIDVYVGPLDMITHDAGKNFITPSFQSEAYLFNIRTKEVPIEASNSMSVV